MIKVDYAHTRINCPPMNMACNVPLPRRHRCVIINITIPIRLVAFRCGCYILKIGQLTHPRSKRQCLHLHCGSGRVIQAQILHLVSRMIILAFPDLKLSYSVGFTQSTAAMSSSSGSPLTTPVGNPQNDQQTQLDISSIATPSPRDAISPCEVTTPPSPSIIITAKFISRYDPIPITFIGFQILRLGFRFGLAARKIF